MAQEKGWKPLPVSLKILFVVFILWAFGSIFAIPTRYELGLPFFGMFVYGYIASLIVLLLDVIAPLAFLFGLWNRKSWAVPFAFSYIGVFIVNSLITFFVFREELGFMPIFIPLLLNVIFVILIYRAISYFKH